MAQIYDSLKALVSTGMISKAASLLDEDQSKVSKAVSSILPSLLGVFMKKGHTPQVRNILEEAGKLDIVSGIENIFANNPSREQQNIGDDFLQHLLGDKAADFTDPIAKEAGISKVATNGLVSMLAPITAGFLGNKLVKDGLSFSDLFSNLTAEKSSFLHLIPAGLVGGLGLSSLLHAKAPAAAATAHHVAEKVEKKPGGFRWLWWLLLLIILLLALFFGWKSCSKQPAVMDKVESTVTTAADNIKEKVDEVVADVKERVSTELTLPNGVKLNAYKGGIEDQIIAFLNSNEYKNSTEDQLKDKWFNFDNIDFKLGSSTELTEGSYAQLDNIINVLKYYKGTKIKIGGYTDKTGTPAANVKLSQERANTIKTYFGKGGISTDLISAEGYGDQFAKYPADAPDSDRVHDRKISLRFVK